MLYYVYIVLTIYSNINISHTLANKPKTNKFPLHKIFLKHLYQITTLPIY